MLRSFRKISIRLAAAVSAVLLLTAGTAMTAFADAPRVIYMDNYSGSENSFYGPGMGWQNMGEGKWKYVTESGPVVNNWADVDGFRYRFDENGIMLTGWQNVEGSSRYFAADTVEGHPMGSLYVSSVTPDGSYVNAAGVPFNPDAQGVELNRSNPYGAVSCVEVDLTNQQVYYYNGMQCVWTAPCVSGNISAGNGTPAGNYAIYAKQTDRILKGYNRDGSQAYASHVDYWMPFSGGYGLHDAAWRGSFGGSIYRTGGSHGCVNLPPAKAAALFGMVSVGTPVIVHD